MNKLIRIYQLIISPVFDYLTASKSVCRRSPTCSEYTKEMVEQHGVVRGLWLGLARILRCNPWAGIS